MIDRGGGTKKILAGFLPIFLSASKKVHFVAHLFVSFFSFRSAGVSNAALISDPRRNC